MKDVPDPSAANEDEWKGVSRSREQDVVWDA